VLRENSKYTKRYLLTAGDEAKAWRDKFEKMGVTRNLKPTRLPGDPVSVAPEASQQALADRLRASKASSIIVNEQSLPSDLMFLWDEVKKDLKKITDLQAEVSRQLQVLAAEKKDRQKYREEQQAFYQRLEQSGMMNTWTEANPGSQLGPVEPERPVPLPKLARLNNTTLTLLNETSLSEQEAEMPEQPPEAPVASSFPTPALPQPGPPLLAPSFTTTFKPRADSPAPEPIVTTPLSANEPSDPQLVPTPASLRPTKALPSLPMQAVSPLESMMFQEEERPLSEPEATAPPPEETKPQSAPPSQETTSKPAPPPLKPKPRTSFSSPSRDAFLNSGFTTQIPVTAVSPTPTLPQSDPVSAPAQTPTVPPKPPKPAGIPRN